VKLNKILTVEEISYLMFIIIIIITAVIAVVEQTLCVGQIFKTDMHLAIMLIFLNIMNTAKSWEIFIRILCSSVMSHSPIHSMLIYFSSTG